MRMAATEPIGIRVGQIYIYIYHLIFPKSRGKFYQAPGKLEKMAQFVTAVRELKKLRHNTSRKTSGSMFLNKKEAPRVAID